jgi:hypothetical protein
MEFNPYSDPGAKPFKRVVYGDEFLSTEVARGDVLVYGGGPTAAWNAQYAQSKGATVTWVGRSGSPNNPALAAGMSPEAHLAAAFKLASAGGRNDAILQPVSGGGAQRFVGELGSVSAADAPATPGAPPAATPTSPTSAGPNAAATGRMAEQGNDSNSPWAPGMESYPSRLPVSTDQGVKTIYAKNVDVVSGPGPARKLAENVLSAQNGAVLGRPMAADQKDNAPPVSVAITPYAPAGAHAYSGPNQFKQVVVSIGNNPEGEGGPADLVRNMVTVPVWDTDRSDPRRKPVGVQSVLKMNGEPVVRALGSSGMAGPGLTPTLIGDFNTRRNNAAAAANPGNPQGQLPGTIPTTAGTIQQANQPPAGGLGLGKAATSQAEAEDDVRRFPFV